MGDIINTTNALSTEYEPLVCRLGPAGGAVPSGADTFENCSAVLVVQSASGSRLDFAQLEFSLTESVQDWEIPESFARMVQVEFPDADQTRIHLGDYVREKTEVRQDGEAFTGQSQLRNYHFGTPISGYDVWDPISSSDVTLQDHIVFNPTIDDRTLFNRSDKARTTGANGYLWTHPETMSGSDGETYHEQTRNEWTLKQSIKALMDLLNTDEEFIAWPNTASYDLLDDAPILRNVRLEMGWYLPKCLDTLLIPLGYNWYIEYVPDALSEGKPRITIFKIGSGSEKELLFQRHGEVLDLEVSNLNQYSVDANIADSFNAVDVFGEFEEVEVTVPLYPGWPATGDSLASSDLAKGGSSYEGNESVWRLFIANEAGDLDPTTSRIGQMPEVPDFSGIFTSFAPHRRVLGECLTYMDDDTGALSKQRLPIKVEYSIDAGATWLPEESNWTIKLLPDQIGVLFDGNEIPTELYDADTDFRLRITGTIFGDSRIKGEATKQTFAVNGRTNKLVKCMPEKFQSRWRQTSGDYASVYASGTLSADEKDDTEEITDYAEKLRDQNQYAEIDCEFRLPGWQTEYKIGDLITKIAGREINLDSAPVTAPVTRYVQIVERRFEMTAAGGPSTVLIVDRGVATA